MPSNVDNEPKATLKTIIPCHGKLALLKTDYMQNQQYIATGAHLPLPIHLVLAIPISSANQASKNLISALSANLIFSFVRYIHHVPFSV